MPTFIVIERGRITSNQYVVSKPLSFHKAVNLVYQMRQLSKQSGWETGCYFVVPANPIVLDCRN